MVNDLQRKFLNVFFWNEILVFDLYFTEVFFLRCSLEFVSFGSGNKPGAQFMNDLSIVIQIWLKLVLL